MKFHENIPNPYEIIAQAQNFTKGRQFKGKAVRMMLLCGTHPLIKLRIFKKFHENISNH